MTEDQIEPFVHPWCDIDQKLARALLGSYLLWDVKRLRATRYAARDVTACPLLLPEVHYPVPFDGLHGEDLTLQPWPQYPSWSNQIG